MKIIYQGPSDWINVAPYGPHAKGEVREYPDGFGADLIATSTRNKFDAVGRDSHPDNAEEETAIAGLRQKAANPAYDGATPSAISPRPSAQKKKR